MYKMKFIALASWTFFSAALPLQAISEVASYENCMKQGWEARKKGDYDEAVRKYRCAAGENPLSEDAHTGLLYSYLEKKDYESAALMAPGLIEKFPENMLIRKGAALAYYHRKKYGDAVRQYRIILEKGGEDPEMRLGLGLSLARDGRPEEGKAECLKCADSMAGDGRLGYCTGEETSWTLRPQVYYSRRFFGGAWHTDSINSVTAAFDAFHRSGIGLYSEFTYLWYKYTYKSLYSVSLPSRPGPPGPPLEMPAVRTTAKNYRQLIPGLGIYYWTEKYSILARWTVINEKNSVTRNSHVLSLHGYRTFGSFTLGASWDEGFYKNFGTLQAQPEIGLSFLDRFTVKVLPMIQYCNSSGILTGIRKKARYSAGIRLEAELASMNLSASGYYGPRWYTVEEHGSIINNIDIEYLWGTKITADIFPKKTFSPFVSIRLDRAVKQYGERRNFFNTGLTAGLKMNF